MGAEVMRHLWPLCLFIIISVFLWKGLDLNPKELPSALVGQSAPAFNLTTVENPNQIINQDSFKNKVTVLNIWATWCVSCKMEHTVWMELTKKHNLFLVGVNYHDDRLTAQQWLQTSGNPYTISLFDNQGKMGLDYGVYGTPETFILDKNGVVRYRHAGPIDQQIWRNTVLPLIESLEKAEGF